MKILVVEDDRKVAGFIEQGLREEGYVVDVAGDGDQGTMLAHVYDYDLLVLDVMLPKKTGLQLAAELRREGRATPILMLTARDTTEDVVRGLDAGADDYLTKLLEKVWDMHFDPESNVVDVHVGNLRRKLRQAVGYELIETVRGVGFRMQTPDRAEAGRVAG